MANNIILENEQFILSLTPECKVDSLVLKANGVDVIEKGQEMAFFSLTEPRPFNNEIKLAHPNKRTTFEANRVRVEGDKLIVGFEIIEFEAVVDFKVAPRYMTFQLEGFNIERKHFGGLCMTPPPVLQFRLVQLPITNRAKFGEWLNVSWDEQVAVNVLAACPYTLIDSERRNGYRVMYADAHRDVKLKNCPAALIVAHPDELLNSIETLEVDYDLPNGVKSRRDPQINRSAYWVSGLNPDNVDEHIEYAKKGGFSMMLIYYPSLFKSYGYGLCGDYDYLPCYPNGAADVKVMLDKIKANGITPGIHFLQTHIGLKSRYCTPVMDHRIRLIQHFTLAKGIGTDDTTIYVEQNPEGTVMHERRRYLNFEGEVIYYEGYTTEYPYCFTGCKRGANDTIIRSHDKGTIGGILDISEYGASSAYVDLKSDLMDEVADKLGEAYNAGFEFIYYDGSEGANEPYEIYIPLAQYIVWSKLDKKPIYCEGAAKAHFSWHFVSGGNAFDVFPMNIFKAMIAKFPVEEAPRMAQDFTRLNFGWWSYNNETMPDIYEYGTSRAAAWDCPVTMMQNMTAFKSNKRTDDVLEVMRRWEIVRKNGFLTQERKDMLKNPDQEHTLLINETGDYELVPYDILTEYGAPVTMYSFERAGKNYITCWHTADKCKLAVKLDADDIVYEAAIGGEKLPIEKTADGIVIEVSNKAYISTAACKCKLIEAFKNAVVVE